MTQFFTKKLFFVLGLVVLLMMLITFPNSNTAGAYDMQGSKVTFYGADNKTPIYDVTVPYGYSLNDLENANLLSNSYFDGVNSNTYYNTSTYNSFNIGGGWRLQSNTIGGVNIISDGLSLHLTRTEIAGYSYMQYRLPQLPSEHTTYYYYFSSQGNIYSGSYYFDSYPTSYSAFNLLRSDINPYKFFLRFEFSGINYCDFNIGFYGYADFYIDYIYVGTENIPYFNQQYVNHLYTKSGGIISDSKNWSQSLVNSLPYKFDSINQPSADLFYVNNTYVYDISNVFNFATKKLSSYSYMTYDNVIDLKNTWSIFSNFNYDNSNILEALKSLVRLFSLFFKLIFYVISLPVSAILDLLALIIIILFPVNAWVLP